MCGRHRVSHTLPDVPIISNIARSWINSRNSLLYNFKYVNTCHVCIQRLYVGVGDTAAAYTLVSAAKVVKNPEAIPGLASLDVARSGNSGASLSFTVGACCTRCIQFIHTSSLESVWSQPMSLSSETPTCCIQFTHASSLESVWSQPMRLSREKLVTVTHSAFSYANCTATAWLPSPASRRRWMPTGEG
jgi:hypothetical protein